MSDAPRVEYDDSFRRDPALVAQAAQAVERHRGRGASVTGETTYYWRLVPGDDATAELTVTQPDEEGLIAARKRVPARFLADPVNADSAIWSAWDDVLAARSDRTIRRIARDVAHILEDEAASAPEPAHAP